MAGKIPADLQGCLRPNFQDQGKDQELKLCPQGRARTNIRDKDNILLAWKNTDQLVKYSTTDN